MTPEEFGAKTFAQIDATIKGHVCLYANEAGLLAKAIVLAGNGNHLEIGSMWGGSAILAALTKKEYGISGKVYCIDPFISTDNSPDFPHDKPDRNIVIENARLMGVELEIIEAYSDPFPLQGHKFASAFVDGDHAGHWPLTDWNNVKKVARVVIYHDLYPHEPNVMQAVEVIRKDKGWGEVEQVGSLAVWRKK